MIFYVIKKKKTGIAYCDFLNYGLSVSVKVRTNKMGNRCTHSALIFKCDEDAAQVNLD